MNEDLKSMLEEARHPVRSQALIAIVNSLYEVGYQDDLDGFTMKIIATNDSVMDAIDKIEDFIFACARSLLDKLGVTYDRDMIYHRPIQVSHIISGLLFDIEEWDDYDTLMAIVDSGEPGGIMLGNLISQITGHPASEYHDVVYDILPKTHDAIRGTLVVKQLREEENEKRVKPEIIENIVKFAERFPNNVAVPLMANYGYVRTMDELVSACVINYDKNRPDEYAKTIGIAAAGLLFTRHDNYEDAYRSDIERLVLQLVDEDRKTHVIPAIKYADLALQTVFGMREDNEQT